MGFIVKRSHLLASGIIAVLVVVLAVLMIPSECSLLDNTPHPFFNCIQDLQELPGVPKLCCWDTSKVNAARVIASVGIIQFTVVSIVRYRQRDKGVLRIF
jgi:hypothetical protein